MTNLYITAWAHDPLIRGAVMQSSDSAYEMLENIFKRLAYLTLTAAQPMWPLNQQIEIVARNVSCPTGHGMLDCLRTKDAFELKRAVIATGAQFQPVTDNITIFQGGCLESASACQG
jgi:hypothetical protein